MSEVDPNINTPIIHKPNYQGERQLLGYNPLFEPNTVTFDKFNRPYIRTSYGTNPTFVGTITTNRSVIQTIRKGKWVKLDFLASLNIKDASVITSPFQEERVVFDRDDDMYTIAHLTGPFRFCLFHSKDYGVTWKSYPLPKASYYTFEYTGIDGNYEDIPLIFSKGGADTRPSIVHLTKNGDELDINIFPYGTTDDIGAMPHSGIPNPGVRVKNKIHVVWASKEETSERTTAQFVTTIDLETEEMLSPVYLGFGESYGDNNPDAHNIPSIVHDGEKFHVVLGAHGHHFKYLQSSDARTWTKPETLGLPIKIRWGGYTYVGLVVDADKTLHLTTRYGGNYYIQLVYMRKKYNQPWEEQKEMVRAFKTSYSVWYHKMAVDRNGRIFIMYMYYGNNLSYAMEDEYHARWPNFPRLERKRRGWVENVKPHDPVILISDDKGDSFRIATTVDFSNGIKGSDDAIRTADINKDGKVDIYDLGQVLTNWGKCDSDCEADIDRDGYVGTSDLASVLVNWGKFYSL